MLDQNSSTSVAVKDNDFVDFVGTLSTKFIDSLEQDFLELRDSTNDDTLFGLNDLENNLLGDLGDTYWDITHFDGWGNPSGDAVYWRQQAGSASCAVVAQISVYQSITGGYISETDACAYAYSQGWFDYQTGTPVAEVGNLLNSFGIATYQYFNATLSNLISFLASGDKLIVGLDANEIWNPIRDSLGTPLEQADAGHAVWVTGIDPEPDGSYKIILNDSGTSFGQMDAVDYQDFYNAWQDYDCFVAVADTPF